MDIKIPIKSSLKINSPNLSMIDKFGKANHIRAGKLEVFNGPFHPSQMPEMFCKRDADPAPA